MPLSISIDRANQLQIEDGNTVVTEFFFVGGEEVSFRYPKTLETLTCVSVLGSNAPVTYLGRAGKLSHPTNATDGAYILEFSATLISAGTGTQPQPSNVKFTLKKKSSGTKSPGGKGNK
jgi:hypothetical protein